MIINVTTEDGRRSSLDPHTVNILVWATFAFETGVADIELSIYVTLN